MIVELGEVDPKDPNAATFYTLNVAPWLNSGATVSDAVWTCPGLTFANETETSSTATAKISGGQDQQDYAIVVTVTTSDSETLLFGLRLKVRRVDTPRAA